MQALVFWLVYPLLWLISILPFRLFYLVSDIVFIVVYYLVGYRRQTVTQNLELVFPEKSKKEIYRIRKKFYAHMCDMFLEMIKTLSISDKELKKRFTFENPEEIQKIKNTKKSIVLMCGHYASYEWMISLQQYNIKHRAFGVYKRIQNPYFDKMVQDIRGKFDGELIPTVEATKTIRDNEEKGVLGIYAMIADQSPKKNRAKYWMNFMDVKAPVFTGSEKLAREYNMSVKYLKVEKIKRGFYRASLTNITDSPREEPAFYATRKFISLLEQQIKNAPEFYLWTHKRWKHSEGAIPENAIIIDQASTRS